MIPDKPISFYHAGFVKFFNQGLKSSFPDSPFLTKKPAELILFYQFSWFFMLT